MTSNSDEGGGGRKRSSRKQPAREAAGVDPQAANLQALIGRRLRSYYDGVLSEPIPDRFAELLDRLGGVGQPEPGDERSGSQAPKSSPAKKMPPGD